MNPNYIPRLIDEAMEDAKAAYIMASTPSYAFSKMRDAVVKASVWMSHSNPPILLPSADELYDTYKVHYTPPNYAQRTTADEIILYAVLVCLLDLPTSECLEILKLIDVTGLEYGDYFVTTVKAVTTANGG